MDKSYYHYLNIGFDSSEDEIKTAIEEKLKFHESQLLEGCKHAASNIAIILKSKDTLLDKQKRSQYNNYYLSKNLKSERYLDVAKSDISLVLLGSFVFASECYAFSNPSSSIVNIFFGVNALFTLVFIAYYLYKHKSNIVLENNLYKSGFLGLDGAISLFLLDRIKDALFLGREFLDGSNAKQKNKNLIKRAYNSLGYIGLDGAIKLFWLNKENEALIIGSEALDIKEGIFSGFSVKDKNKLIKQAYDHTGFTGLDGAIKLYESGKKEEALIIGSDYLEGYSEEDKLNNLVVAVYKSNGIYGLEGARKLYAGGKIKDALLVGGKKLPYASEKQNKLYLSGYHGLKGAIDLYKKNRIDDAYFLLENQIDFRAKVFGVKPGKESQSYKIINLQLAEIYDKKYVSLAFCDSSSIFLLDFKEKQVSIFIEKNYSSIKLFFKDILGLNIIKNETEVLTTKKPYGLGNVIVGDFLFGTEGVLAAGFLSKEETTSKKHLKNLVLEVILDCDQLPIFRLDCLPEPDNILFYKNLLELAMMNIDLSWPTVGVSIFDHVRMIRLKSEKK